MKLEAGGMTSGTDSVACEGLGEACRGKSFPNKKLFIMS
jgi:hypothetical protein